MQVAALKAEPPFTQVIVADRATSAGLILALGDARLLYNLGSGERGLVRCAVNPAEDAAVLPVLQCLAAQAELCISSRATHGGEWRLGERGAHVIAKGGWLRLLKLRPKSIHESRSLDGRERRWRRRQLHLEWSSVAGTGLSARRLLEFGNAFLGVGRGLETSLDSASTALACRGADAWLSGVACHGHSS